MEEETEITAEVVFLAGQSVTSEPQEVMVTRVEDSSVTVTSAATRAAAAANKVTVENCIVNERLIVGKLVE